MPKFGGLGGLGGFDLDDLDMDTAKDFAKSSGAGYLRGIIALLGTPADVGGSIENRVRWLTRQYSGETPEEQEANLRQNAFGYGLKDVTPSFGSRSITEHLYRLAGHSLYRPQSQAGEVVHTVAEFVPSAAFAAGGVARKLAAGAIVPGLAAEGAGNLPGIQDSSSEPYARAAAAVLAGGGASLATAPRNQPAGGRVLGSLMGSTIPAASALQLLYLGRQGWGPGYRSGLPPPEDR